MTPFNAKEQRVYYELSLDDGGLYPVSKAKTSHPIKETNLGCSYPGFQSFGHDSNVMTIGEGWNINKQVN